MSDILRKTFDCDVKRLDERTFEFTASTEDIDRDGENIIASGWDLKNFKKNPVIMYGHDYRGLPIGRSPKVWIENGSLKNRVEFPPDGIYDFADIVRRLVDAGYLKAESVGFIPIEWEDGDGAKGPKRSYKKAELLEISIVPIPSNPNALVAAKSAGIITDEELEILEIKPYKAEHSCRLRNPADFQEGSFRRTDREHDGKKYSVIMGRLKGEDTMTEQAYRYAKETWTEGEASRHCKEHNGNFEPAGKMEEDMEVKAAISYQSAHPNGTPKADEGAEWDAGREIREADIDDLKVMCAILMGDPENKTSYKLPHHTAKGHKLVWRAVAAGGAALMGARGGINAPEADKAGAKAHLAKHYREFDKEPPWEKGISQAEIKDELDYVATILSREGLNEDNLILGWKLVGEIMRLSGSDMPVSIQTKVGAVLNRKNLERLEQIKILAQEVIDSAKHEEEPEKAIEPELTMADISQIIRAEVAGQISKAQGKINWR